MNIYFEGCGLLVPYYFGVVKALEELRVDFKSVKLGGSSAGSIVAMMIALGFTYKEIYVIATKMTEWSNTRKKQQNLIYLTYYLDEIFSLVCENLDMNGIDEVVSRIDNLYIKVTCHNFKTKIISSFQTLEDIRIAVYGSCNLVPFFDGFRFIHCHRSGSKYLDACFSTNNSSLFKHDEPYISISPFNPFATIHPCIPYSIFGVCFAHKKNTPLINQGYRDTIRYFTKKAEKKTFIVFSILDIIMNIFLTLIYNIFFK